MRRTKNALALSALALMAAYVLAYIEKYFSSFNVTRSASTIYEKHKETFKRSYKGGASARVSWNPRWHRRGEAFARSFYRSDYSSHGQPHWWCTQDSYDKTCRNSSQMLCDPKGLLFVKTPKTGSTTISKIVKQIVVNVAQRSNLPQKCQHREDHVSGAGLWYANRDPSQSFMMASLRDPASRAMSRFFWSYVSRHSQNGTEVQVEDDFIIDYLNTSTSVAKGCTSKGQGGYQLSYIAMSTIPEWSAWSPQLPAQVSHRKKVEDLVQQTLLDYDFFLLNERMEDSLVILQFLLGLQPGDIVSLPYNVGGSYQYENGKCKQLIKTHTSPGMQEYFHSAEWHAKNYGDYLLYAAVNRSIDLTIDKIGRGIFDAAMQDFLRLEAKVKVICPQRISVPCSVNGTVLLHRKQPIVLAEISQCIDEIVRQEQEAGA